ncbi:alkyl hydroperoxide reductase [Luteimonas sp. XNQY3]|nr:thioredoxin-like domain-containing protein [Luteimonas sp. XNQY3]MCD9004801.1 alkyl hydroperoxide reductase [Luteimonas sp. XNQY3]
MRAHGSTSRRPRFAAALAGLLAGFVSPAAVAADVSASDPGLRDSIARHLVRPEGARFVPFRWEREPDIVALYFGADWCGPCHVFVPTLREVRDALRAAGADTEVVYVSLDTREADMRRYMRLQDMPWPAIDHRRLRTLPAIRALGGTAPPNLVLIDRDGRVLASGWDGRGYTGLQPVLDAWMQRSATSLAGEGRPVDALSSPKGSSR